MSARTAQGPDPRWWQADPEDLGSRVLAQVRRVHQLDSSRRATLERGARLYGPGLSLGRWQGESQARYGSLSMNVVRALVQTAASSLLQNPPPRPWFLTDGADWETQKRARGMTRLAEGALARVRFDEQARGDALISAALGCAVSKIFERDGAPVVERVMPWQVLVDPRDGWDGKPRSLYQIAWVDREVMASRYRGGPAPAEGEDPEVSEEVAAALEVIEASGSGGLDDDPERDRDTTTDQIFVGEAWHLPSSEDAGDGRHVIFTDRGVLLDEKWEEADFPFAFFRWGAPLTGFWGPSVADEIWTIQYEINLTVERIRQILHTVAVPRVWVEEMSRVSPSPLGNEIAGVHYYRGAKPLIETPRQVAADLWQYLEYLWGKAFQLLGISELAASAMKPGGLDSGKALRIYADLSSGRLNQWSRAWHDYYLAVSRQLVSLMRRIGKKGKAGEVMYLDREKRRLRRVKWSDVAMQEGTYEIECFAVSSLPSDPAGRTQMLEEWLNAGVIDLAQYRRLINAPDLGAETALMNAPREVIESAIDAILFGTDDEAEEALRPGDYDDVDGWIKWGTLHQQAARVGGVPLERIALLENAILEAQAIQERRAAAAAPPPPPPGAAPPGLPPGPGALPPGADAGAPVPPEMLAAA